MPRTTTTRRRYWSNLVEDRVEELVAKGRSASQIRADLGNDPELAGPDGKIPDLRTIQRRVREIAERDVSGAWSLPAATPLEAAVVAAVLPTVIHLTYGAVATVSQAEARCLANLAAITPGLPPWPLYLLARAYVARVAAGVPSIDLDAYAAFRPWAGPDTEAEYRQALGLADIPPAPAYLYRPDRLPPLAASEEWAQSRRFQDAARAAANAAVQPFVDQLDQLRDAERPAPTPPSPGRRGPRGKSR